MRANGGEHTKELIYSRRAGIGAGLARRIKTWPVSWRYQLSPQLRVFCKRIVLDGAFTPPPTGVFLQLCWRILPEKYMKKLLQPPFCGEAARAYVGAPAALYQCELVFVNSLNEACRSQGGFGLAIPRIPAVVLRRKGQPAGLCPAQRAEQGGCTHFGTSGRHWFTGRQWLPLPAVGGAEYHQGVDELRPPLRLDAAHLPFIRQDFASVPPMIIPFACGRWRYFLVGVLPLMKSAVSARSSSATGTTPPAACITRASRT